MGLHPFFASDQGYPLAISHSGDSSTGAPPGSLASYQAAWEKGFRCFQVDVVALANDELVASHAITGRKRSWEGSSVAELRATGHDIATVDEILDAVPDSRWNFEIKSTYATAACAAFLLRREEAPSRFLISSPFRPVILQELREAVGSDLAIAASLIDGGLLGFGLRPGALPADAVQLWKPLVRSQRLLDRYQRRNVHVQVWSVNKAERVHHYLDRGVPGIITDEHDTLIECLQQRDQWLDQS